MGVLPAVLLVGVGVVAAVKAVNNHQCVVVFVLDLAELPIPLHVPFRHDIHVGAHALFFKLISEHPFALITVEPKAFGFRHWNIRAVYVERDALADVLAQCLAHCGLTRAAVGVDQQQPWLGKPPWNQILKRGVVQLTNSGRLTAPVSFVGGVCVEQPINGRSTLT